MSEPMDTSEMTFGCGRGRGLRRSSPNNKQGANSPLKVAATQSHNVINGQQSVRPKVTTAPTQSTSRSQTSPAPSGQSSRPVSSCSAADDKLQKAVERTGIPVGFFDNYFSLNADRSEFADCFAKPNNSWYDHKPEVKEEEEEDEKKEKKYQGIQYSFEAKAKEKKRVQQELRELKEGQSSRGQSPAANQTHSRVGHNTSTLSLQTTLSTNVESVGTYQQLERMDAITEDEETPNLIERYFKVKPRRQKLPINDYEDRIIKAINANRVVIIEGATGCGKTTQVPQYIADDCAAKGIPFNIVVTQPRRIAAISIANRVAKERDWQVGTIVGYQIGMDKTHFNIDTRILYCTTGVLLQKLIGQQKLDNYSHIVIDEIHERSIDTDLLLLVIKKLMNTRSHSVKIILMSATFDPSEFQDYFTLDVFDDQMGEVVSTVRPTCITIKERPQELHIYYLAGIKKDLGIKDGGPRDIRTLRHVDPAEKDAPCVSQEAIDVAVNIIIKGLTLLDESGEVNTRGSVLVFLPGLEEIHEMKARLDKCPEKKSNHWLTIPLHSSIPIEKQNLVFISPRGRERKIILATNIAESSITVPDVQYVIDFCLTKSLVMDYETHIPVLKMEWASRANCKQRAGRAGRCAQGRVYRLVTETFWKSQMIDFSQPELNRSPLDLSILRVKMLNMGPPKDLLGLALTPPDLADIYHSVLQLKQVGAFAVKTTYKGRVYYEDEDGDLTILGRIISRLPIDIRLGKLICLGHVFDVLRECIVIAACLSTQGMFRRDFGQGLDAYKSRMAWASRSFSDPIAHMNAYMTFKKFSAEFDADPKMAEIWCRQNFIQFKRVKEVDYMFGELLTRLTYENISIPERPNQWRNPHETDLILKVVMCAAFYPNFFTRNEIDLQRIAKDICSKDPMDTVVIQGLPPNQGPLYTQPLREMFKICSNRIDIGFEDSKAYLTFLDDKHPLKAAFDLHIPDKVKRELINGSHSSLSTIKSEDRDTPMSDISTANSTLDSNMSAIQRLANKSLKETTIKTAVYVAVAMRHHREVNKDMPKLIKDVAEREMKSLQKYCSHNHNCLLIASPVIRFQSDEHLKRLTFNSKRVNVPHVLTRMKLTRLRLPALDCSEMEIRVTHIENPSLFWAQYSHKDTVKELDELSSIISYEISQSPCVSECIQIGDIVIGELVESSGAKMHGRARIDNIEYKGRTKEVETVTVFFIDYGMTKVVDNVKELSLLVGRIPQRMWEIPPQAFRCALSEVNPSPIVCYDSCWSKKSIDYFKKYISSKETVIAKIYSVTNRMVRLELFDNVDRAESFNDLLVSIGYAEKWEENPQSKLNHDARRKAQLMRDVSQSGLKLENPDKKGVYDPDDVPELEIKFDPMTREQNIRSHEKISVKGPYSPLECRFTGICLQTSHRSVTIDRNSVNCVVLEPDYLSKHTRLLVASSMGLGQNTGNINLRDTTLMPNIRGFPALMAVLFAPRVQLRANKERTQYLGAICGIGYNKQTMKSYDPQYDSEIVFDSEISLEDMVKVNIIRYNISSLMKSKDSLREYTEGSLAIKQRKVWRNMIELLDRRRRLIDNTTYYPNFKWSDITADDINSQLSKNDNEINADLLPLCEMQRLNPFDYFKDIKENLQQLKALSEGAVSMTTKCKLCKHTVYTRPDMYNHLSSDQHLDAIKDFNKEFKLNEKELIKQQYYTERNEEGIDDEDTEIFDIDSDNDEVSIVS